MELEGHEEQGSEQGLEQGCLRNRGGFECREEQGSLRFRRNQDNDLKRPPNFVFGDPHRIAKELAFTTKRKTAIWFWMTPQSNKPSSHNVITGRWSPSAADNAANRVPGYGVITNIINGGLECNKGTDPRVQDRIGFYKRYCDILGVGYGNNLDCNNQRPFA
ncbi:Chitinase [Heracleum sosnowskyi]|uniref:Chitinase n=1 Tax=Heracleum sosnowskyi TaxID=360622 RepID=A0AAD8H8T1_9APIA|nr:Chitinase [Heracleum sosnowskyi]KAK1363050.1 Chitinase [Heracleum sosnowskyi]